MLAPGAQDLLVSARLHVSGVGSRGGRVALALGSQGGLALPGVDGVAADAELLVGGGRADLGGEFEGLGFLRGGVDAGYAAPGGRRSWRRGRVLGGG